MERIHSGDRNLDAALGGGFPLRSSTLLHGRSFIGKERLADGVVDACLKDGMPVLLIATQATARSVQATLIERGHGDAIGQGLVQVVDTYSVGVGETEAPPWAQLVDAATDLANLHVAVNRAQAALLPHGDHLMVIDSISTLVLYTNPAATFRFMQVLLGRSRMAGGTSLLLCDDGIHSEAEVNMFMHATDGCIRLRVDDRRWLLCVEGLGAPHPGRWVEYQERDGQMRVIGHIAEERIL